MKYRTLYPWKYQLLEEYTISTPIVSNGKFVVNTAFVGLKDDGTLKIKRYYAWDGATGAIDTNTNLRASLLHDAFYQLIKLEALPKDKRKAVDKLFRDICIEDGMCKFRAWYLYIGLRLYSLIS
jgi:hypothetical protein